VRALELLEVEERPEPAVDGDGPPSQLWTDEVRRPTALVGIVMERSALYRRIDARAEEIAAAGAIDEVRRAEVAGASRSARAALGYRELLAGDLDAMKRRTRNYAKRQLTWMRKLAGVSTVDATGRNPSDVAAEVERLTLRPGRASG
jgi:tRNA dimethylallyltransferase